MIKIRNSQLVSLHSGQISLLEITNSLRRNGVPGYLLEADYGQYASHDERQIEILSLYIHTEKG